MQSSRFVSLINVKIYVSINGVKALSETHRARKWESSKAWWERVYNFS